MRLENEQRRKKPEQRLAAAHKLWHTNTGDAKGHLVALKAKLLCCFLISWVYLFICRRLCDWMKEAVGREEGGGTHKGTERERNAGNRK